MRAKIANKGIGTSSLSSQSQQPIIVNRNSDDFLLSTPNAWAGFNSQLKRLSGWVSCRKTLLLSCQHTSPCTVSQKRRTKHLGVCRLLKVLFAIFTNRSIQQQQKTATQHIHNTQQQPKWATFALPTLDGFALSFHGHVSGAPNAWRRGSLWPHARCPWLGLAAPWSVPLLGGQNEDTAKNREGMVVWP